MVMDGFAQSPIYIHEQRWEDFIGASRTRPTSILPPNGEPMPPTDPNYWRPVEEMSIGALIVESEVTLILSTQCVVKNQLMMAQFYISRGEAVDAELARRPRVAA